MTDISNSNIHSTPWPEWTCPECGSPLQEAAGSLRCAANHSYPIAHGIPRFVPSSDYAAAFGLQWRRYRQTQLDSFTGSAISAKRMERCLGGDLWNRLAGMMVLECGCGAGRFTEILLNRNARVVSVDLSDAVDANVENCPVDDNHRIAQADINALPFRQGQFDVVFCLGVVQHTPSPEQTIASLASHVRPGGWLVFDHYTHNLSHYTKTAMLLRHALKRLPPETGLKVTEKLVDTFLPLHKGVRKSRIAQMLLSRVSPVACYYQAYPSLSDDHQRQWALLDTHDGLTDTFKHFRTQTSLRRTVEQLGLTTIWSQRGGNGVELRAQKP